MKAILMQGPGGVEQLQLGEIPRPTIAHPRQLLIRIEAAGINPIDTKLRKGGPYFPDHPQHVLGCDGAGVVEEIGAECGRFQPGDAVYYFHGGLGGLEGNYTEYAVVDERYVAGKPENLSFAEAAAAPLALITAWEALFERATLGPGDEVLIHAGAGGVGHLAIQLATHRGARVATTVGSAEKAEFVRSLGAERAILYKEENFVAAVQQWSQAGGARVVFDTIGGPLFNPSLEAARHYGEVVTLIQIPEAVEWKTARLKNLRISQELMLSPVIFDLHEQRLHQTGILEQCCALFETGKLQVKVSKQLPLEQATEAHRLIERGDTFGKVVLTIN
jgi:NADPH2:quinone reductase